MHQKRFYVTCEVTGTYTEGEPTFMRQKKCTFTENCVGRREGSEFQGLFTKTTKIQDLLKIIRTMFNIIIRKLY